MAKSAKTFLTASLGQVHLWVDFRVFSFIFLCCYAIFSQNTFLRCTPLAILLSSACLFLLGTHAMWEGMLLNVEYNWTMQAIWGQSNSTTTQKTVTNFSPFRKNWRYVWNRPSILCVTHNIKRNYSAVPYEIVNYKWYQQVLGQYKAILAGSCWYWVRTKRWCLVLCGTGSA